MKKVVLGLMLGILGLGGLLINPSERGALVRADADDEMKEIVVTASRKEKPLNEAPLAATVISARELDGKNTLDLAGALEDQTDLRILHYGSLGAVSTVHLRGLYGSHTLVMVDDRVLNAPSTGEADLSWLSTDNVERIEIVRGPTSALYGGNAVAGVVNIITKSPPLQTSGSAATLFGSYQTNINQLAGGATLDKFSYLFDGNYKTSQGNRPNSAYHAADGHLKIQYHWNDATHLMVDTGSNQYKTDFPGAQPAQNPALRTESQLALGDSQISTSRDFGDGNKSYLNAVLTAGNFKIRNYLNLWDDNSHQEWVSFTKHYTLDSEYQTAGYGSEVIGVWTLTKSYGLTSGLSGEGTVFRTTDKQRNVTDGVFTPDKWRAQRSNYAAFLQNEFTLGAVRLNLGGRWDHPTDFAGQFSTKTNLIWTVNPASRLELSYGDSYRPPSLNDLNWPQDSFAEGNPHLKPEKGHSYELGWEQKFSAQGGLASGWGFRVSVFRQLLDDMIAWAPTGTMGPWGNRWTPTNLNTARETGLELRLNGPVRKDITFNLTYAVLDAHQRNQELRDSVTNLMESETRRLAYAPAHKADGGLSFANLGGIDKLSLDLGVQYVGAVYQYYSIYAPFPSSAVSTQSKRLNSYWLGNLKLRKAINNLEISVGVENLTNKQYATQFGTAVDDRDYPMPGRTVLSGLTVKF